MEKIKTRNNLISFNEYRSDVNKQIATDINSDINSLMTYEEVKETQKQNKLQRRINMGEKAKYLRKRNSEFLNGVREELENCFLQTLNCDSQLNKLWK